MSRILAVLPALCLSFVAAALDSTSLSNALPTSFDYLVLASLSDSQQPFSMVAGYRRVPATSSSKNCH